MKCGCCGVKLEPRKVKIMLDIKGCSAHPVDYEYSECPKCRKEYADFEQMSKLAKQVDAIEARKY